MKIGLTHSAAQRGFGDKETFIEISPDVHLQAGQVSKEGLSYYQQYLQNRPFALHLPQLLPKGYPFSPLEAHFLAEDEVARKWSLKMVAENLKIFKGPDPSYYVLHFPGVIKKQIDPVEFRKRLHSQLKALNAFAKEAGSPILLEYFGFNENFYSPKDWIEAIAEYDELGILVDTGHLYFASVYRNFDFLQALEDLAGIAKAVHLWAVKGPGIYQENEVYLRDHHYPFALDQKGDDFAYEGQRVMEILEKVDGPIVLEYSYRPGIKDLYEKSIKDLLAYSSLMST